MSAKRFIFEQNGNFHTVIDTVENKPMGVFEFKENEFPAYACFHTIIDKMNELHEKNEQLEQDNNALIHLLENQSTIIQELHLKLLEYQVKEPITLTKEDLELMDKAVSYYTHGRCGE